MKSVHIGVIVLLFIVIEIQCERIRIGVCNGCHHEQYTRIKRAKYYSNPPLRFYNKPPMSYPIKGIFSLTPPPGYVMDDDRQPNSRLKVSKRPAYEGTNHLGDEDMNNIINFLSKQELDKLMEFANENEVRNYDVGSFTRPNFINTKPEKYSYDTKFNYNDNNIELNKDNAFAWNRPTVGAFQEIRPNSIDYNTMNIDDLKNTKPVRFPELEPSALFINKDETTLTNLNNRNRIQNQQFGSHNAYAYQEVNENRNGVNIFTDSSNMQEEQLPKPSNLREDDFEVSYTNNVATVVKANSGSYKVESLGELPLMNYHSKLDTVDSYRVPHYTVTSPEKHGPSSSNIKIPVEPAPPASVAQEQSDAHLKAIKIWTHKSKGTAYTLHDDGTLSLEKPLRPRPSTYEYA